VPPTGQHVNTNKAEELIAEMIADELGVEGAEVDCPATAKEGDTFHCSAKADGVPLDVKVTQTDDKGGVDMRVVSGTIDGELAEKQIAGWIKKQSGTDVEVDCGRRNRLSKPGATFECTARDAGGETLTVAVDITSETGDVNFRAAGK
jgi:hypothetical protein